MADILYKLNYPIVTPEAYAFWDSRHKLNRIKAIMAFSLNLDNANDNLRRAGYYRQYRKRYLEVYKTLVAQPAMQPPKFVLSDMDEYWWDPKPINGGPVTPPPAPVFTVQPNSITNPNDSSVAAGKAYFQVGGKLEITGAAASDATSWQWQKQNSDSTWGDVVTQTNANLSIPNMIKDDEGKYRVKAINVTGSVTSDEVTATCALLYLQNDNYNTLPITDKSVIPRLGAGPFTMPTVKVGQSQCRLAAFIKDPDNMQGNISGAVGTVFVTTDPTVTVLTAPADRHILMDFPKVGSAVVTATIGNLSTTLTVTVSAVP